MILVTTNFGYNKQNLLESLVTNFHWILITELLLFTSISRVWSIFCPHRSKWRPNNLPGSNMEWPVSQIYCTFFVSTSECLATKWRYQNYRITRVNVDLQMVLRADTTVSTNAPNNLDATRYHFAGHLDHNLFQDKNDESSTAVIWWTNNYLTKICQTGVSDHFSE